MSERNYKLPKMTKEQAKQLKEDREENGPGVAYEMMRRAGHFMKALKNPTKRIEPKPTVAHPVDVTGFNPKAEIHIEDPDDEQRS